jgi:hypothetical protein
VAEIAKAEEKLAVAIATADKIRTTQAKPEHEKAPAAVREATAEKVRYFSSPRLLNPQPRE